MEINNKSVQLLLLCSLTLFSIATCHPVQTSPFSVGFYRRTCPPAEEIISNAVNKFISKNPGLGAGLLRLHFHDCFVRGCDASVLLDALPGGPAAEKDHPANNPSLRGFEIIDAAKAILERVCPRTVSCADILAFAARDSVYRLGNIWYEVPAGRRDGNTSLASDIRGNLPPPFFTATQNAAIFKSKGFSADEMVTLSGAHSIGISHCTSFASRLYPTVDPTLNAAYAKTLKRICPPQTANGTGSVDPTVNQDPLTPNRLDNLYYVDVISNKGLLTSDQTMLTTKSTAKAVLDNARYGSIWAKKFAAAMVKMGKVGVLTGKKGQIRLNCHFRN
ncbi:peroxidase 5-like [Impatiens glandulifera]|uniref:peroxidase 5-like n=1 Tax=Impatiens glandulifera TaxID=253017 RepID=UPI001FB1301E|nr:peroxidase 5-like [Impatiens glandulifera]XP_047329552.1 peroxidase 5-like [Impatiens glandulifera]